MEWHTLLLLSHQKLDNSSSLANLILQDPSFASANKACLSNNALIDLVKEYLTMCVPDELACLDFELRSRVEAFHLVDGVA